MLLEVQDLKVKYGGITALDGVSIKIEAGKIICIVGANGAGKSTMINAISGAVPFQKGKILLEDKPLPRAPQGIVRRGIVQVPEGRKIFPSISVKENLILGGYTEKNRRDLDTRMESMFERFPVLGERRNQGGGTLSGGEQQMLAIARALMSNPRILLLDEPSLGLAPLLIIDIFEMITDLNKQGLTILLVEQNAQKALAVSDYSYVMETGRIISEGPSKDLIDDPIVKQAYLGKID